MFTADIRINGTMVVHIYGRNTGERDKNGKTIYKVDFYQPEKPMLDQLIILHDRNDGINTLIIECLKEAEKHYSSQD